MIVPPSVFSLEPMSVTPCTHMSFRLCLQMSAIQKVAPPVYTDRGGQLHSQPTHSYPTLQTHVSGSDTGLGLCPKVMIFSTGFFF